MKEKSKLIAGLLFIITLFSFSKTTKASDLNNQLISGKIAEVWLTNFADDKDKILAVCQSTAKFPKDWVVIGQGNVDACRNNSISQPMFNAWYIKKPANEENVCQGSPMPDNYVVSGEVKIAECPGGSSLIENKNGWAIKLVE